MKKIIVFAMAIIMLISLMGCDTESNNNGQNQKETKETVENADNEVTEVISEDDVLVTEDAAASSDGYSCPNSLSNNWMDCDFRLEGKLYSLPAPVSEFINDGWEIKYGPDTLPAEYTHINGITMKKNKIELTFQVTNFSDIEINTEDAVVTGINIIGVLTNGNDSILKNLDFELSGGIKLGMSVSDLKNKVDISKFTVKDSAVWDSAIEYSYFTPSNSIYLTFDDDKLIDVNFEKRKEN